MAPQRNELAVGRLYSQAIFYIFCLAIAFAILAVALSVFTGLVDDPGASVEHSIQALWHLVTTSVGGLVGLITGPGLTRPPNN